MIIAVKFGKPSLRLHSYRPLCSTVSRHASEEFNSSASQWIRFPVLVCHGLSYSRVSVITNIGVMQASNGEVPPAVLPRGDECTPFPRFPVSQAPPLSCPSPPSDNYRPVPRWDPTNLHASSAPNDWCVVRSVDTCRYREATACPSDSSCGPGRFDLLATPPPSIEACPPTKPDVGPYHFHASPNRGLAAWVASLGSIAPVVGFASTGSSAAEFQVRHPCRGFPERVYHITGFFRRFPKETRVVGTACFRNDSHKCATHASCRLMSLARSANRTL